MIIHNKANKWYVTNDTSRSSEFDSYEELQHALLMFNLPTFANLRKIKSSQNHKRYVPM